MTADTILAAYPACPLAVAYCELFLDTGDADDPETCFDILRATMPPVTLDEALAIILEGVAEETEGNVRAAAAQMREPSFRTYLAAKMGLM